MHIKLNKQGDAFYDHCFSFYRFTWFFIHGLLEGV
jgi:hypothetical protein